MKRVLNPQIQKSTLLSVGDCFLVRPSIIWGYEGEQFCFWKITKVLADSFVYESIEFISGNSIYLCNKESSQGFYPITKIDSQFYDEIFQKNDAAIAEICGLIRKSAVHINRIRKGDIIVKEDDPKDTLASVVYCCDRHRNVYACIAGASEHSYDAIYYDPEMDLEDCEIYEAPQYLFMPAMKVSQEIAHEANRMYKAFSSKLMEDIKTYLESSTFEDQPTFYYFPEDSLYINEAEESDFYGIDEFPF